MQISKAKIQVILEYQWTPSRDLIEHLEVDCATPTDFFIASVIKQIASEGFDIEDDHRISYFQPLTRLYVHLGRAAELATKEDLLLSADQFSSNLAIP